MIWWVFSFALLGLILWIAFRRTSIGELESDPHPIASYEEALARVKAMQEGDSNDLTRDVCITKLYDHGNSTEHVIILIHGFTNCPEQFKDLSYCGNVFVVSPWLFRRCTTTMNLFGKIYLAGLVENQ